MSAVAWRRTRTDWAPSAFWMAGVTLSAPQLHLRGRCGTFCTSKDVRGGNFVDSCRYLLILSANHFKSTSSSSSSRTVTDRQVTELQLHCCVDELCIFQAVCQHALSNEICVTGGRSACHDTIA